MKKITFIGAGSVVFTRNVFKDLLTYPAFADAEICLMDINEKRLQAIVGCCERIKEAMQKNAVKITATTDRKTALIGSDAVICTVFNGDIDIWQYDIEIPKKYGVDVCIGDTRSVSGIFRALRNIPLMLEICADVEKYCKNAVLLNYTNPMTMLCKAMLKYTKVDVTGLCHSVQHTSKMLADWAGVDYEKLDYTCLGINHQAFFTKLEVDGKDVYPILREKIKDPVYYKKEKVRNEVFKTFGYYVTESSGHCSEYVAWFRKRPDLIEKYLDGEGANWDNGAYAFSLNLRRNKNRFSEDLKNWYSKPVDVQRGQEYAANILNARLGDGTPFQFNANLLNEGTIENLSDDTCVEIPVVATKNGYERTFKGKLPSQLAALVSYTASIENLVVEAFEEKSKRKVIQAVALDPLCSAVLSLEEVTAMCEELFEVNQDFLGDYK